MKNFIGYLYLLIKPVLLFGLITSAHGFQMAINWEYYDLYDNTEGFFAYQYMILGVILLCIILVIWIGLYYKKKKHYGSAEIMFDRGVNKYLTILINTILTLIYLCLLFIIPYWIIDVPNGDFA